MRKEFQVHRLNEEGMSKANKLAEVFSEALTKVEEIAGADGREMAVARTKLEEASYFAKRAMAQRPENQFVHDERLVRNCDDADRLVDKLLTGTADEFRVPAEDAQRMGGLLKDLLKEVRSK